MDKKKAIIIGAGPAGLTAAFELLARTDFSPLVIEKSGFMGGISRTVNYKGNRMDIGGHRFFSKSDRVMEWWLKILPLQDLKGLGEAPLYHGKKDQAGQGTNPPDPEKADDVMLLRSRRSRIYCFRRFFDYPISLSAKTLKNLGLARSFRIGLSYMKSALFPIKDEKNLEQFFINRFGRELYRTFFKSYTEKVWGASCRDISAAWGAQRVKGLSVWRTLAHILKKILPGKKDISAKSTETSLIEQFLYPKFGPGQMWEKTAEMVREKGGEIITDTEVTGIFTQGNRIKSVEVKNKKTGETRVYEADLVFSTMPVKDLIRGINPPPPDNIKAIGAGLVYRDFIAVGLLLEELKIKPEKEEGTSLVKDNWIYIQEPDVDVGRLQIFNNWSPYMVADKTRVWIGLEYFCNENDRLWNMPDEAFREYATRELDKIGIIDRTKVLDGTVIRMPKTYPAYFGTYNQFDTIRTYLDGFENLYLIGRNGMHRYNNQDHSMLSAMVAVDNICSGRKDKENIWDVNTEQEFHESK